MKSKNFGNCFFCLSKSVFFMLAATFSLAMVAHAEATATQQASTKSAKVAQSLLEDIVRIGDRLVVVGERGHIAYSDDSGTTWTQAEVPTQQMLNAVFFVTPDKGWAVGYDGLILNTTDGGKTWAIQLDGLKFTRQRLANQIPTLEAEKKRLEALIVELQKNADAASEMVEDENMAESAESAGDASLEEAQDKLDQVQTDLDDARAGLEETVANPLMDVWFADEQTGFVIGAFGEFLKTTNGGQTWESIADRLDNGDRNHLNAIAGRGSLLFIVGEAGLIMRSNDAGDSWERLPSPDEENGSFFAVTLLNDKTPLITGLRGSIYRSVDSGNSWKQIPETLDKNLNAVLYLGNETVLLGGNDGALFRSRDGCRTVEPHIQKNRLTIAGIAEAPNGSYVLVGVGGVHLIAPANL